MNGHPTCAINAREISAEKKAGRAGGCLVNRCAWRWAWAGWMDKQVGWERRVERGGWVPGRLAASWWENDLVARWARVR